MYAYIRCYGFSVGELEWSDENGCWQTLIGEDCWIDFEGDGEVWAKVYLTIGNESELCANMGPYDTVEDAYADIVYRLTEGRGIESFKWIVNYV